MFFGIFLLWNEEQEGFTSAYKKHVLREVKSLLNKFLTPAEENTSWHVPPEELLPNLVPQ